MDKLSLRAYKCIVELTIHEVTAPGVRLANKDDLYLNVCLLGQQRRTRLVSPIFPLKISQHLVFEKTFKYARDEADVANFLNDLNVLVELIQLGRTDKNEVLAWHEQNVKEFLYPDLGALPAYYSLLRGFFMTTHDSFPGSISPQIIFCTSTRITETQTPSLDILREYENRFVNDPVMEIHAKKVHKKRRSKKNSQFISSHENFANHTISSAIKADYTLPDVKKKISELNRSVKKTKIVKTNPGVKSANIFRASSARPFVVRKADEKVILRKPELHDVLHDGLVLTKKSPKRIFASSRRARSRPASRSASARSRLTRSLSPGGFSRSLNEDLAIENYRPPSRKSNLDLSGHDHSTNNCEVCLDHDIRGQIQDRANRLNNIMNTSAVFSRSKSPLNDTRRFNSDELARASFLDQYNETGSFREAHGMSKIIGGKANKNKYPTRHSMRHYSPPSNKIDWQYARYYPWLFNYTEYLRDLEEELHWLKLRSKNFRIY